MTAGRTIASFMVIWILLATGNTSTAPAQDQVRGEKLDGYHLCKRAVFASKGDVHSNWITPDWLPVKQGIHYKYSARDIPLESVPLDDESRSIVTHNEEIKLHFGGLDPKARFMLRLEYLSNSDDRVFSLLADGEVLQDRVSLPCCEKKEYILDLPASVYRDEKLDLVFKREEGQNVVLSTLELYGDREQSLLNLEIEIQGDFHAGVFGTVRDGYNQPVAGADLELRLEGTAKSIRLRTGETGEFRTTVPQDWRNNEDRWIFASTRKGRLHGDNILASMEVFIPRLSPKPLRVESSGRTEIDLKGVWEFHPDPPDKIYDPGLNTSNWARIEVPGEWGMQGFEVPVDSAAAYRRWIHIPEDWAGKRVKLRFDAVYSETDIWFNGKYAGHHMSTYTPLEVDVSEFIQPGKPNLLAMEVTGESLADDNTANYMMIGRRAGGIIRRTSAFVLPGVNIALMHVETTFDEFYEDAVLKVFLEIANESSSDVSGVRIDLELSDVDPKGEKPVTGTSSFELGSIKSGEYLYKTLEIPVESPKHWNAENPNLYYLDGTLSMNGRELQVSRRRIGFRQLEIRGNQVYINGSPTRLRGISRQDSEPLWGRTVPEETLRREMEMLDGLNINNVYTCAFSPDERILDLADELGMYMFEEPSTCWIGWWNDNMESRQYHFRKHGVSGNTDPKMYMEFLRPVVEMIQRSRSHPSAMTWMIADESAFIPAFERVRRCVKVLDPARPVHFAWDVRDERIFDLGSHHYPSYMQLEEYSHSTRPVIFDQFFHIYRNRFVLEVDPGIRNEWVNGFAPFWERIWDTPAIWGGQIFNYTDDIFLMPSGEVLGYGAWGVIDLWRRQKPEAWHIKKAYSPAKIHDETLPLPIPAEGEPIRIPIENRYDFTNLNEVRIEWSIDDEAGRIAPDIPPHTEGFLSILPETDELEGKILFIDFYRDGALVDAYRLRLGEPEKPVIGQPSGRIELQDSGTVISMQGNGFSIRIDRADGQMCMQNSEGKEILSGGPQLVIMQENNEIHTSGFPWPRPELPSLEELNQKCTGWKLAELSVKETENGAEILVAGSYREAAGMFRLNVGGNGIMTIGYEFTTRREMQQRQIGVLVYLPGSFDELSWKRQGRWSSYPGNHIGRREGTARAFRDSIFPQIDARTKPPWPWELDSNAMGTNEFRATRTNILEAALRDRAGAGIRVSSDGSQQVRAFVERGLTGMLVSDFYSPGLGSFNGAQLKYQLYSFTLPENSVIKGMVTLEFIP